MLHIPFQSEGFPQSSPVVNGNRFLEVTWSDLLWAALTVGRPSLHYVFQYGESSITYFKRDILNFYWVDPPANNGSDDGDNRPRNSFGLSFSEEVAWRGYFEPIANLLELPRVESYDSLSMILIPEADLTIRIHSGLARSLRTRKWVEAFKFCMDKKMADEFKESGLHGDGIGVEVGKSWERPYNPGSDSLFKLV